MTRNPASHPGALCIGALALGLLAAAPAAASSDDAPAPSTSSAAPSGSPSGSPSDSSAAEARMRANLAADGYAIREVEREGGRFEVVADKDGRRWEIYVDARTGDVLKIEAED